MTKINEQVQQDFSNAFSVEALLTRVGLKANSDLWSKIESVITVYGKVTDIRATKGSSVYFDLVENGEKIECKCSSDCQPIIDSTIVFSGQVHLYKSHFSSNSFKAQVVGRPVFALAGMSSLDEGGISTNAKIVKRSWLKLSSFINSAGVGNVAILGTKTGVNDVRSQLSLEDGVKDILSVEMVTTSKEKALKQIDKFIRTKDAIFIVRGGDDATLDIWDDREFVRTIVELSEEHSCRVYVALGHSHRSPLMDKFADESFPTPTALGQALNQAMFIGIKIGALKANMENLIKAVDAKDEENKGLVARLDLLNDSVRSLKKSSRVKKWLLASVVTATCVGVGFAVKLGYLTINL